MYDQALSLLRQATENSAAVFHKHQWQCIAGLLDRQRLLVVQKTGWGKSMVYFLATRLLRAQGAGPSIIISPLLALMNDQVRAATNIGVNAVTINSSTRHFDEIALQVQNNQIDAILIAPEQLSNQRFIDNILTKITDSLGLFVVDEAHCISDWGHDFRPDYRRISRIVNLLPSNTAILATTATANNRVVDDIEQQLGSDLTVIKGSLLRESLRLQNIVIDSQIDRLAWMATYIPTLEGSGIIYALTIRDATRVAEYLKIAGIVAKVYHGQLKPDERSDIESQLIDNQLKVVVATVALGMGFDKRDLSFVIHFQRPQSLVHYYQQIGRAGRGISEARAILLAGSEDKHICRYFVKNAFPAESFVEQVLQVLRENDQGLSINGLMKALNIPKNKLEHILKFLSAEQSSPIYKSQSQWFVSVAAEHYQIDQDKITHINDLRAFEQDEVTHYIHSTSCLMNHLQLTFNEQSTQKCGKCANCAPKMQLAQIAAPHERDKAKHYLDNSFHPIKPRLMWPQKMQMSHYGFKGRISEPLRAEQGRALSLWRDSHFGELVASGKACGQFDDVLLDAGVRLFKHWHDAQQVAWVTYVPSANHPKLVRDYAWALAQKLKLPFYDAIGILAAQSSEQTSEQKRMQNAHFQLQHLDGRFNLCLQKTTEGYGPCLLVDDVVSSGWTMTVCAALLAQVGVQKVFPMALALNSPYMD